MEQQEAAAAATTTVLPLPICPWGRAYSWAASVVQLVQLSVKSSFLRGRQGQQQEAEEEEWQVALEQGAAAALTLKCKQ